MRPLNDMNCERLEGEPPFWLKPLAERIVALYQAENNPIGSADSNDGYSHE